MATRRPEKRTARATKAVEQEPEHSTWLDYFRFGESYTSLILGIIVVIITTVLLVFLVRDRNVTQMSSGKKEVSSTSTKRSEENNNLAQNNTALTITVAPPISTTLVVTKTPTATPVVTKVQPTQKPTAVPTKVVAATPTKVAAMPTKKTEPTKAPTATKKPEPTNVIAQNNQEKPAANAGKTYTVASGDNLWSIAEKHFKSGYNWVDIARANNLSNPGVITVGMKLTIPNVPAKVATVGTAIAQQDFGPKITGTTYKVQKGDHLWGIAVRAYNDGYKWVEIARVNNIKTPDVINVNMELKLPRTNAPNK